MTKHLLPLFLLAFCAAGLTDIYKCVGPDGSITFSENPFCEHQQAYARDRNEPLLTVNPEDLSDVPPGKVMEIMVREVALADLLEQIGKFAGITIEPMALEGYTATIEKTSHHWLELFNELVTDHALDYRQAYGRLYVYKLGGMGETIVHSPSLLRWYQGDDTWNVVRKFDEILIDMKAYEKSLLRDRERRLITLVREELGEKEAVNAAESIHLKKSYSGGVGSGILSRGSEAEELRRAAEEKARQITERRQSN